MELLNEDMVLRGPDVRCPLHINPELEIIHLKAGELRVKYDLAQVTLAPGQILLILPYHLHAFEPSPDCMATVYMFSRGIYNAFINRYPTPAEYTAIAVDEATGSYLEQLHRQASLWTPWMYAQCAFCALVNIWLTGRDEKQEAPPVENMDQQIITYIFEHLAEELTADSIARHIGWNSRKLSTEFKRKYGIKLLDFIGNVRTEQAATLLLTSRLSVTEIANQCGFASLRNFNRIFKARMGISPTCYRKKNASKGNA